MPLDHIPVYNSHMARLYATRNAMFRLEVGQIVAVRCVNRKSIPLQMLDPLASTAAGRALVDIDGRPLLLLAKQRRHHSDHQH